MMNLWIKTLYPILALIPAWQKEDFGMDGGNK